jgi:hypothetical protein
MKKITLLLFVTAFFQVNAQYQISNPVTNAFHITCQDHYLIENAIEVPEGEFWTIIGGNSDWRYKIPISDNTYNVASIPGYTVLTEGCLLYYVQTDCTPTNPKYAIIKVYNYGTGETLTYNDVEPLKDRIKLFPNPTTNQLALNSDKVYQIEVFDLTGNKVMELKGNTINVEHLSSATYIVNTIDLETKESLSYKVIKK